VRQKRNVPILQSENVSSPASAIRVADVNDFAFPKVISSTIGTKLLNKLLETRQPTLVKQMIQP
jgi:hypothetical protein